MIPLTHFKETVRKFKEGDIILVLNVRKEKLAPKFIRPFKILKRSWLSTYTLETPHSQVIRHQVYRERLT